MKRFNGSVANISKQYVMIEILGIQNTAVSLEDIFRGCCIKEMVLTGAIALRRGSKETNGKA